jgi:hypothetical protein
MRSIHSAASMQCSQEDHAKVPFQAASSRAQMLAASNRG